MREKGNIFQRSMLCAAVCAAAGTDATSAEDFVLEEIVVTAQKREQNMQEVPISVQAVGGEKMMRQGVTRLEDVADFVPGVKITDGFTGKTLSIRGITSNQGNPAFEQSVATFIDGLYMGRSQQSQVPFLDVDRVEVLRGAQPTFFGQNAIAGALNITTKGATDDWEGYLNASYGTDNEKTIEGAYGGPLTESLGIRLAGRWYETDGYMEHTFLDDDGPQREDTAARIVVDWSATENLRIKFKYEDAEKDQVGTSAQIGNCSPLAPTETSVPAPICEITAALGIDAEYQIDDQNSSGGVYNLDGSLVDSSTTLYDWFNNVDETLESNTLLLALEYDFDSFLVNFNYGSSEYDAVTFRDFESTPIAYRHVRFTEGYDQDSYELRFTSTTERKLDWMLGFYYQDTDLDSDNNLVINAPFGAFPVGVQHYEEDTWTSAFGAITYHFTETLDFDIGIRYTEVEKKGFQTGEQPLDGNFEANAYGEWVDLYNTANAGCYATNETTGTVGLLGPFGCAGDEYDTDDVSYNIGLNWDFNEEVMLYAKYSTGFKSGGFNASPGPAGVNNGNFVFDDESVKTLELGAKTTVLEGRLELNYAIFTSDYTDLQVTAFDTASGNFLVSNAGEASQNGIEIDGRFAASENLTFGFSVALLDAEFEEFVGQCSDYESARGLNGCSYGGSTDRSGYDMLFAPTYAASLNANYVQPLSDSLEITLSGDVNLSDEYWVSDRYDPEGVQDAYQKINLRAAVGSQDGTWQVALYGRNITDEETLSIYGPSSSNGTDATTAVTARGASYGIQATYNF